MMELSQNEWLLVAVALVACGVAGGLLLHAHNTSVERGAFKRRAAEASPERGGGCVGALLVLIGMLLAGYYFLLFDVSVAGGGGERVVNFGKMHERTVGLVAGLGLMILGAVLRR